MAAAPTPGMTALPLERVAVMVIGAVSVFGELETYELLPVTYSVIFVLSALTVSVYGAFELTVDWPPDSVFAPVDARVQEEIVAVGVVVIATELPSVASMVCVDAPAAAGTATHRATIAVTRNLFIPEPPESLVGLCST